MKIPYATLTKVLMDQIYNTYIQIRAAQDPDSDGGRKVTRKEVWEITSSRSAGVAILKHNHQYRSSFKIGMRSSGYECLVPCKDIPVWRDGDRDEVIDYGGEDHDSAGIQIHRANSSNTSLRIGRYSAGCVVLQTGFNDFMDLCHKQVQGRKGSTFTLTILKGIHL